MIVENIRSAHVLRDQVSCTHMIMSSRICIYVNVYIYINIYTHIRTYSHVIVYIIVCVV